MCVALKWSRAALFDPTLLFFGGTLDFGRRRVTFPPLLQTKCHFVGIKSDDLASEDGRRFVEGLPAFGFDSLFGRVRVLNANTFRSAHD